VYKQAAAPKSPILNKWPVVSTKRFAPGKEIKESCIGYFLDVIKIQQTTVFFILEG
jgi:hypothetical protein